MRAFKEGKPEYIPVNIRLDTEEEFTAFLEVLHYAMKDKVLGGKPYCCKFAEQLYSLISYCP